MPKKESKYIKSKLIDSVQYEEREEIEDTDKKMSVLVYDYELLEKDVEIAVGKRKYKGTGDKMVAYFPIYLLSGDVVKAQIGVFEILPKYELDPDYLDENNELNLDNIDVFSDKSQLKLNLYGFVNKKFLNKYNKMEVETKDSAKSETKDSAKLDTKEKSEKSDAETEDKEEDPTELHNKEIKQDKSPSAPKTSIFEIDSHHPGQEPMSEETKEDDDKMKADYVPSHTDSWIKTFMKNNHYRIYIFLVKVNFGIKIKKLKCFFTKKRKT
jgi:hypothetical protein